MTTKTAHATKMKRMRKMAEIEILFPTVQYGNVKLRATPEELGLEGPADAYALGVQSAVLLNLFTQGFKVGSQLDVSGAPASSAEPTENEAQAAIQEIQSQLGATEVESGEAAHDAAYSAPDGGPEPAPWESMVDAKPKPWETSARGPAPAQAGNDSVASPWKAAPTSAVKVAEVTW